MQPLSLPRHIVQQRFRPPKTNIPQTPAERNQMLQFIRHYVAEYDPVPPLPVEQLKEHADRVVGMLKCDPIYRDYVGVLLNNELWRETLAAVPYERRLLLLPKCLRVESKCPAPFDEFGLLCKQCGLCSIQDLQEEAEGTEQTGRVYTDLDALAGAWVDDPGFDDAIALQDRVDETLWR